MQASTPDYFSKKKEKKNKKKKGAKVSLMSRKHSSTLHTHLETKKERYFDYGKKLEDVDTVHPAHISYLKQSFQKNGNGA